MSGLSRDDIISMAREVADKDKVDPLHNDMVTLTIDELGKLLAAEREACAALNAEMLAALYAVEVWLFSGEGTGFQNKVSAAIDKAEGWR